MVLSRPQRFRRSSLLLGLLASVGVGTVALILTEGADIGVIVGAFLGGLISGRFTGKPLDGGSRGAAVGVLSLLVYEFFVIPILLNFNLIVIPEGIEFTAAEVALAWVLAIAELVGGGFIGGIAGYYLTAGLRPKGKPEVEVKPAAIPAGRCPRCGEALPPEAIYCPRCGFKVKEDVQPV